MSIEDLLTHNTDFFYESANLDSFSTLTMSLSKIISGSPVSMIPSIFWAKDTANASAYDNLYCDFMAAAARMSDFEGS